jgi:arginase family enzyme
MMLRNMKKAKRTNRALSIFISEIFWDGIDTAFVPGVAARQALGSQPGALEGAVPLYGG